MSPSLEIEDFRGDWKKEWFIYSNDPQAWQRRTHKVYNDKYKAPESAQLSIEVRCGQPNKLVVGLNNTAAEIELHGGNQWQTVVLSLSDFKDAAGNQRTDWEGLKELRLSDEERLKSEDSSEQVKLGTEWKGTPPEFRALRWVIGANK